MSREPRQPHPEFPERSQLMVKKLRYHRDQLGLTELDLIALTGLGRTYLQWLTNPHGKRDSETGEYKFPNPSVDVIWTLASALKVSPSYLIDPTVGVGETGDEGTA